jgi:YfiH family protein
MLSVAPHVFTTRAWRLGSARADEEPAWGDVASALGLSAASLVRGRQVHGAEVLIARPEPGRPDADIVVGADPSLGMAVQVADCVPLLLADPRTGATAAAHAGWRGVAARVPEVAVAALARSYGARPSDLLAAIGPAIGPCCYEVGDDVRRRFEELGVPKNELEVDFSPTPAEDAQNPPLPAVSHGTRPGRWFLNLWAATRRQLVRTGMRADRVFVASLCTASHPDVFCSYRRDGSGAGRIAAAIRPRADGRGNRS